jgi:hypothetical protein
MIWPSVGIVPPRASETVAIAIVDRYREELTVAFERLGPAAQFRHLDFFTIEWCAVSDEFCHQLLSGDLEQDMEPLQSLWTAAVQLGEPIYKKTIRVRFSNGEGENPVPPPGRKPRTATPSTTTTAPSVFSVTSDAVNTVNAVGSITSDSPSWMIAPMMQTFLIQNEVSIEDHSTLESESVAAGAGRLIPGAASKAGDTALLRQSRSPLTSVSNTNTNIPHDRRLRIVSQQRDNLRLEAAGLRRQCELLLAHNESMQHQVEQTQSELREQLKEAHHAVHKWQLRMYLVCAGCGQSFEGAANSPLAPISSQSCSHTLCRSCVPVPPHLQHQYQKQQLQQQQQEQSTTTPTKQQQQQLHGRWTPSTQPVTPDSGIFIPVVVTQTPETQCDPCSGTNVLTSYSTPVKVSKMTPSTPTTVASTPPSGSLGLSCGSVGGGSYSTPSGGGGRGGCDGTSTGGPPLSISRLSSAMALMAGSCDPTLARTKRTSEMYACPLCRAPNAFAEHHVNESLCGVIAMLEKTTPRYRC